MHKRKSSQLRVGTVKRAEMVGVQPLRRPAGGTQLLTATSNPLSRPPPLPRQKSATLTTALAKAFLFH